MFRKNKYLGIITGDVVTASEDTPARDIARMMKDNDIGVVVIVNGDKVTGVVSERDITRRVVAEGLLPDEVKTVDFMTKKVITVDIKEGLNKIYQTLCEIKSRHLIIVDGDKLVGITSRRDMLDVLSSGGQRRQKRSFW